MRDFLYAAAAVVVLAVIVLILWQSGLVFQA